MSNDRDYPDENDGYIEDVRDGYAVILDGTHIGTYTRLNRAQASLYLAMERTRYWPNLWRVNERGNTDQFVFESYSVRYLDNGFV